MYLTKEQYEIALDGYSYIDKAVKAFAEEYEKEFCGGRGWVNKVDFDPEAGTIDIEEEYSYCGCCSNDYENVYLPISYLWDESWVGREKEKRDQDARDREKRAEEEKAARKKAQEEKRYQKFLEMKKEYEGEGL
jgi:hypothetical protein